MDDATLIDRAWLTTSGPFAGNGNMLAASLGPGRITVSWRPPSASDVAAGVNHGAWFVDGRQLPPTTTRGAVRRLWRVLNGVDPSW